LQDFEGKYAKAAAGLVVGGGAGATIMQNDKGVVINLTGVGQGVEVRLALSGMAVQLVNELGGEARCLPFIGSRHRPRGAWPGECAL
jgi:hypothetical protein